MAGPDHDPMLGTSAPNEPFAPPFSTKRSIGVKNQDVGTGGMCAALAAGRQRLLAGPSTQEK
jgi:hypothetical protein